MIKAAKVNAFCAASVLILCAASFLTFLASVKAGETPTATGETVGGVNLSQRYPTILTEGDVN